jgi:hypothetical protein
MRQRIHFPILLGWILSACTSSAVWGQPPTGSDSKAQQAHSSNDHDGMMHRGEKGMGFSQTATTHHFLLKADGGVISVTANDPKDTTQRDQVRMHLTHIAHAFSEGNFNIPLFVHDQEPPGVPTMKRLAQEIRYELRETDRGGEVAISSKSAEAVQAVHEFLVLQIREHKTGDPVSLP